MRDLLKLYAFLIQMSILSGLYERLGLANGNGHSASRRSFDIVETEGTNHGGNGTIEDRVGYIGGRLGNLFRGNGKSRSLASRLEHKGYTYGSLYTQILGKYEDDVEQANDYLIELGELTGASVSDLKAVLNYFADIDSLTQYKREYDKSKSETRGMNSSIAGKGSKITGDQIRKVARVLLTDNEFRFRRDISEVGTYYADRLARERRLYGDDAVSLYKEALASRLVTENGGISRLMKQFGRKNGLAIAQLVNKYENYDALVSGEIKELVKENSTGIFGRLYSRAKELVGRKSVTPRDFLFRSAKTEKDKSELISEIFDYFNPDKREKIPAVIRNVTSSDVNKTDGNGSSGKSKAVADIAEEVAGLHNRLSEIEADMSQLSKGSMSRMDNSIEKYGEKIEHLERLFGKKSRLSVNV